MPSIPEELTYAPTQDSVQNVVLSKSEVYLQSPEPEFSPAGASRITFQINTQNFIDLSSVEMYAKLSTHVIGAADPSTTTNGTAGATKLHLNSTMSLFSDITISTGGGTIIEQLSNAAVLGAVLGDMGLSDEYCATVGSFSNSQCDANDRDACIDGTESYRILALKMSGFLTGSQKLVRPSSMGGIHISCTLAPNVELMVVRNAADNATFKMTETRLYFDEVVVSPSYLQYYTEQYEGRGLQIVFPSYGSQLGQINGNGPETVPFSASAMRCQALMAAVRLKADNVKIANSLGFRAPGADFSYTYEIAGARLPPAGISSYARAFDQILKISGHKHNSQHSLFKLSDFNSNYSVANRTGGKFVAAVDCERLESSSQTGIRLSPGSNNLLLRYGGLTNGEAHDVFIFWMYDRALSVVQGQSTVTY